MSSPAGGVSRETAVPDGTGGPPDAAAAAADPPAGAAASQPGINRVAAWWYSLNIYSGPYTDSAVSMINNAGELLWRSQL